jgi:hypothetical protein
MITKKEDNLTRIRRNREEIEQIGKRILCHIDNAINIIQAMRDDFAKSSSKLKSNSSVFQNVTVE